MSPTDPPADAHRTASSQGATDGSPPNGAPDGSPPNGARGSSRPARPEGRVVALTGAASFLGRNLIGVLEEDPRVSRIIALDIKAPDTGGEKTRVVNVDLTAPGSVERVAKALSSEAVDTLVHLCFLSSPTHGTAWAHELESIGTMHLLNAARQVSPRKLILWSQTSTSLSLPIKSPPSAR
jgi:UDP-glucose 4-epimerase